MLCRLVGWATLTVGLGLGALHAGANASKQGNGPDWATVLTWQADPAVVTDAEVRARIDETGLPWRVVDKASGVEFLLVPPGEYLRGAAPDDPYDRANERPQHRVKITKPFYLGRYEVTNEEMRRFRPDHDSGVFPRGSEPTLNEDNQPAANISWDDAEAYAEHFGFRLPSEAEWEYAARAGVAARYPWGNDIAAGQGWGNIFNASMVVPFGMDWEPFPWEDGFNASAPVGSFRPNGWGFFDMFGNVWEWVEDGFDDAEYQKYSAGATDPVNPEGPKRALRGGGFGNAPRGSGIPYRWGYDRDARHFGNGFRVARTP